MDITVTPFAQARADLLAEGYVEGVPRRMRGEAEAIVRQVCAEQTCMACGHLGLEYRPFRLNDRAYFRAYMDRRHPPEHRYRPLAVCPACGTAEAW